MASNGHVIMKGKPNGQHGAEQVAGGHEVSQDREDLDSPAHMYESLEEEYTTLDGSEGTGVDVAFEDEEEEEDWRSLRL